MYRLSERGTVIVMGDFNALVGSFGGPRSLTQINSSRCVIGKLVDDFELPSVNSQPFCQGSLEIFYSNGDKIRFVLYCAVIDE